MMVHHPEEALQKIVPSLHRAFGGSLRSAIVTGSVVKMDFVPYYSDLDIHVFLEDSALMNDKTPRLDLAIVFRDMIGSLNPEEFGCGDFQISFVTVRYRTEWAPYLPETYRTLSGDDPKNFVGEITTERFLAHARRRLDQIDNELTSLVQTIVDKPDRSLPRLTRLVGAYLKGQVYNAVTVLTGAPMDVWPRRINEVVPLLEPVGSVAADEFFHRVRSWPECRQDFAYQRELLQHGLHAMADFALWWHSRKSEE